MIIHYYTSLNLYPNLKS